MTRHTTFCPWAALGVLLCLALLFPASPATAAEFASVKKDGVNIRSGPGTDQEILWEVFRGFPLKIEKRRGKWARVRDFEGDKGWIYAPLLAKKRTVIVKVNTANMRVGPGKNYEITATVKYGVVFVALERENGWVKVRHEDGTSGWIYAPLLWP